MNLTYKQLAFILDIESIEAVRKIIFIHCKVKGIEAPLKSGYIKDYYWEDSPWPMELGIELLAQHLNLPELQRAVDDIRENYMKRPPTKKYILCDYPEKELKLKLKDKVKIPPVLASLLKPEDVELIENEWAKRYGIGKVKEEIQT